MKSNSKGKPQRGGNNGETNKEDTAGTTPIQPMDSKLTPQDIGRFRELLLAKRQELVGDVDNMTEDALKKSRSDAAGDLSCMPIHMADIGSDNYEQEFTLGLIENEQNLLKEIDEALQRIDKGNYGVCMATGKPIGKARLKLKPWAKYSIDYVRQTERNNGQ